MSATQSLLSARSLVVRYGATTALEDVTFELQAGERVALMGPSGSGKSTLLHCLAGVVRPDEGEVRFEGSRLDNASESSRSTKRLRRMGVVFQFGGLVPELTLVENVMLPLQLTGTSRRDARSAAVELLVKLDIGELADSRAGAVSGGQAQRAAVARALVHRPAVVLADEPTGSLDSLTSEAVLDALVAMTEVIGAALLVITHDHVVASHLERLVLLRDGRLEEPVGAAL